MIFLIYKNQEKLSFKERNLIFDGPEDEEGSGNWDKLQDAGSEFLRAGIGGVTAISRILAKTADLFDKGVNFGIAGIDELYKLAIEKTPQKGVTAYDEIPEKFNKLPTFMSEYANNALFYHRRFIFWKYKIAQREALIKKAYNLTQEIERQVVVTHKLRFKTETNPFEENKIKALNKDIAKRENLLKRGIVPGDCTDMVDAASKITQLKSQRVIYRNKTSFVKEVPIFNVHKTLFKVGLGDTTEQLIPTGEKAKVDIEQLYVDLNLYLAEHVGDMEFYAQEMEACFYQSKFYSKLFEEESKAKVWDDTDDFDDAIKNISDEGRQLEDEVLKDNYFVQTEDLGPMPIFMLTKRQNNQPTDSLKGLKGVVLTK